MLVILPVISFGLILIVVAANQQDWRESVLATAVIWGVLLTAITEGLSLFDGLTRANVALAWMGVGGVALIIIWRQPPRVIINPKALSAWWPGDQPVTQFWAISILVLMLLTGSVALVTPSTDYDSMTYHLSRGMHWIQQRSVDHYPTHIMRQLYLSPWSDFAIMQSRLLSGGDRYAQFLQWLSVVGSLIGLSLIGDLWGSNPRRRWLIMLVAVTLPIGLVQASSTQNNHIASFWIICTVYAMLRTFKEQQLSLPRAALIGASAGLAVLTKGIVYVYIAPFLLWFSVVWLRRARLRTLLIPALLMISIVLAINVGHWRRNWIAFGNPTGPETAFYHNDIWGPSPLASNVVRNVVLHTNTPWPSVNEAQMDIVATIHQGLGLDPNDRRTTWRDTPFEIPTISYNEIQLGNPLHLLLGLGALVWVAGQVKKLKTQPSVPIYAGAVGLTLVLFCGVFKWMPWHTRLHIPFFLLSAPLVGYVLASSRQRQLVNLISLLLVVLATYSYGRVNQPLSEVHRLDRTQQYFVFFQDYWRPYNQVVDRLVDEECTQIGFVALGNSWEYPLWVLLTDAWGDSFELHHVNVMNASRDIETPPFEPCALVFSEARAPYNLSLGDTQFTTVISTNSISLMLVDESPSSTP